MDPPRRRTLIATLCPMRWLVDFLYLAAAALTSPISLWKMTRTGKSRTDWHGRFGRTPPFSSKTKPRILFHAVSVGEVNAIRALVDALASDAAGAEIFIATTTDTGFARAKTLWGATHCVVRYPFDFSFFVERFLKRIQPDVVVLVELEVWPNFTAMCHRRDIPIVVVNGRLTARSFRRYRWLGPLIKPSFRRLSCVAAQNQAYADRFETLGVPKHAIHITGTMKWDTAKIDNSVDGANALAEEMGIDRSKPLIVAGSTSPDEHALIRDATPKDVQLLCAPRKPEWFDNAAAALPGCSRRSNPIKSNSRNCLFLLDTIGELRQAYALADVVIIGRSFGSLHGSDMMEPIALGKATIVGPAVSDFQDTVDALLAGGGVVQTTSLELPKTISELLDSETRRFELAERGRTVIRANQGATERNRQLILQMLSTKIS